MLVEGEVVLVPLAAEAVELGGGAKVFDAVVARDPFPPAQPLSPPIRATDKSAAAVTWLILDCRPPAGRLRSMTSLPPLLVPPVAKIARLGLGEWDPAAVTPSPKSHTPVLTCRCRLLTAATDRRCRHADPSDTAQRRRQR